MSARSASGNRETTVHLQSGWGMLALSLTLLLGSLVLFFMAVDNERGMFALFGVAAFVLAIFGLAGLFSLQPNEARVLLLFGAYKGTVRDSGFHWGNPFYSNGPQGAEQRARLLKGTKSETRSLTRNKISLRARTLNVEKLKVNDKRGNPIEIAAVVVWRVEDTAQAVFDVDDYEGYVLTQSESALRHLATQYSYDDGGDNEITLRSNIENVSQALRTELQERIAKAGVVVDETRLTHLAYAPEIAQAMLRRQQAEAVIAAREKIVHGAVSMVDMALRELSDKGVVNLDDERRASMVSNLMVVLCGESEVHPVVNTGTLYT